MLLEYNDVGVMVILNGTPLEAERDQDAVITYLKGWVITIKVIVS